MAFDHYVNHKYDKKWSDFKNIKISNFGSKVER